MTLPEQVLVFRNGSRPLHMFPNTYFNFLILFLPRFTMISLQIKHYASIFTMSKKINSNYTIHHSSFIIHISTALKFHYYLLVVNKCDIILYGFLNYYFNTQAIKADEICAAYIGTFSY